MDSTVARAVEGEQEKPEKTSVLKRVRAKAKKIKDTLGMKAQEYRHDRNGQDHDHDHEEEEECDEKEEIVQDPGTFQTKVTNPGVASPAALPKPAAPRNFATAHDENSGQVKVGLGEHLGEDTNAPKNLPEDVSPPNYQSEVAYPGAVGGREGGVTPNLPAYDKMDTYDESEHHKDSTETGSHNQFSPSSDLSSKKTSNIPENAPSVLESFSRAGEDHPQGMNVDDPEKQQSGYIDNISNAQKNQSQDVSPANYLSKVTDPGTVGGQGGGVMPIDKMDIYDESENHKDSTETGSRDQFSPSSDLSSKKTSNIPENAPSVPESFSPTDHPQGMDVDAREKQQSGYTDNISNALKDRSQDVSSENYQSKVTDPGTVGGQESGVTPILPAFDKMDINDEPEHYKDSTATGSHDQFSPSSDLSKNSSNIPENAPSVPESFSPTGEDHPQGMNVDAWDKQQSGYTDKISNSLKDRSQDVSSENYHSKVTDPGTVGGQESGVTPILPAFDKVDINDESEHYKDSTATGSYDQFSPSSDLSKKSSNIPENAPSVPESFSPTGEDHPQAMNVDAPEKQQSGYTDKISSLTSAIAGTAISAKNVAASKIGYGGINDNMNKEDENAVSAGNPMAATESVGEPNQQPSSYTGKISSATSAIADKAVPAKNVVASNLGDGGNDNPADAMNLEINKEGENAKTGGGVTDYGTATDKLTPVYEKVAGAVSAVASKLPGTATHTNAGTDVGSGAPVDTASGVEGTTDKGVGSVKGYLAEKLKPGEEDRALSEVVSDAFHKRNNDEDIHRDKPMGKVTESEEVANRLGSSESERTGKVLGTDNESPKTGVVAQFKGAFTNWFGKGGETHPSQAFNDQNTQHSPQSQGRAVEGENVSHEGESTN